MPNRVPVRVRVDDRVERRVELREQIDIAGRGDMAPHVDEPQRAVGGVVLEPARVGSVGKHALRHRGRRAQEKIAALLGAPRAEEKSLV